jgi:hypothetical protein
VNWSLAPVALVPPAVVTVISIVPAEAAGEVAVIWVAVSLVIEAVFAPKLTAEAFARFVPVIVIEVPPAVVPEDGLTDVTAGGDGDPLMPY